MKEQINAVKRAIEALEREMKSAGETYRDPVYAARWVENFGPEALDRRCKIYEDQADDLRQEITKLWNVVATLAVCESMMGGK
jgi:hypothetical protein